MDGIHDFGGASGYGPVVRESDEPAFHERWEAGVFTMVNAVRAADICHNTDQFRHAVERINEQAYLEHSYYGRWLGGLENLLVEAGALSQKDIEEKVSSLGGNSTSLIAAQPAVSPDIFSDTVLQESGPGAFRKIDNQPAFQPGEWVKTLHSKVLGHTRLPAYARGKKGQIIESHAAWVYPDSNAHGQGEMPQYLYTVAFSGSQLWGAEAEPGTFTHLDLFEPYLMAVSDE
jgi:nitrile hydratase beta subunit